MTWRWGVPTDHDDIAVKQAAKKYEKRIVEILESAAADENVDFDALATKLSQKVTMEKAARAARVAEGAPKPTR